MRTLENENIIKTQKETRNEKKYKNQMNTARKKNKKMR